MDAKDWQKQVDEWISPFEKGYGQPSSMMLCLIEEVWELDRELPNIKSPLMPLCFKLT
ncbi:hypothetical protein [Pelotomaculum sp. FP]|uniref:hypothetical protein n=1 Tax=Pelotomaculum sp. FP TaxID=261474 RepID=UPI001FAA1D6A|nr:hypothetical protein [Pelotomaculum sp. FP]